MPAKKMRVEVFDETGNRYTVTFEGQVSREKALRLIDIIELLGGMPGVNAGATEHVADLPKVNKIRMIFEKHFPIVWFSSKDVQAVYEQELKEPIGLSTVATYLTRMAERGVLTRSRASNIVRYRLLTHATPSLLNVAKDNK
jgi:hypothetical protein